MRAAIALRDVVGEAEDVFVIAVVPFERDIDADAVARPPKSRSARASSGALLRSRYFTNARDPAFVIQVMLSHRFVPLVAQQDAHARIEERELTVTVLELVEIELEHVLEGVGAGREGHAGALLDPALAVPARARRP